MNQRVAEKTVDRNGRTTILGEALICTVTKGQISPEQKMQRAFGMSFVNVVDVSLSNVAMIETHTRANNVTQTLHDGD